jgi:hypothetical protein
MLVLCFLRVISILFGKYRNYVKNKSCFVLSGFCFLFFVFMFFCFFAANDTSVLAYCFVNVHVLQQLIFADMHRDLLQ